MKSSSGPRSFCTILSLSPQPLMKPEVYPPLYVLWANITPQQHQSLLEKEKKLIQSRLEFSSLPLYGSSHTGRGRKCKYRYAVQAYNTKQL